METLLAILIVVAGGWSFLRWGRGRGDPRWDCARWGRIMRGFGREGRGRR